MMKRIHEPHVVPLYYYSAHKCICLKCRDQDSGSLLFYRRRHLVFFEKLIKSFLSRIYHTKVARLVHWVLLGFVESSFV